MSGLVHFLLPALHGVSFALVKMQTFKPFWKACKKIRSIKTWIKSLVFAVAQLYVLYTRYEGLCFLKSSTVHCPVNLDCNMIVSTWIVRERSLNYFLMSLMNCLTNMQISVTKIKSCFYIHSVMQKNKLLNKGGEVSHL